MNRDKLILGDCLDIMHSIPDKSIDCIICDLPYHISACKWDCLIPFDKLWQQYKRIIKPNRAICLFGVQPFTSALVNSNLPWYKYNWVWYKHSGSNFLSSHLQPLKVTEDICVFADGATSYTKKGEHVLYNPQFTEGKPYVCKSGKQRADTAIVRDKPDAKSKQGGWITKSDGRRYPTNVLDFPKDKSGVKRYHATAKPVDLLRYLIRTYSNEGDIILDNTMGSASTIIAAIREKRHWIGIEKDPAIFEVAKKRVEEELKNPSLL